MASSKDELQRAARKERSRARAWVRRHGFGGLPPTRRLETGEGAKRERSGWLTSRSQPRPESGEKRQSGGVVSGNAHVGRSFTKLTSYDELETRDDWEQAKRLEGEPYNPLVGMFSAGRSLTPEQLARRAQMNHVLSFMLPYHIELLHMRYVEEMTLEAMAAELKVRYQSVQDRLATAEQDFLKAFGEHAQDDIDITEAL